MPRNCRPTSAKSSALTRKVRISQNELPESLVCDVRQLGRVPAHVDADRHGCQHAGDPDRRRGQVREVAGEQCDRDLGRRVVDATADLAHDVADRETDGDAADHVHDEAPGRTPERERARDRGGDGGLVDDERDAVVDEALALDDRDDAPRRADTSGDLGRRERVGRRDDRPERERAGPAEARRARARPRRSPPVVATVKPDREQRDRPQVRAQVAQAGEERRGVEKRRQDRDEHEIRRQLARAAGRGRSRAGGRPGRAGSRPAASSTPRRRARSRPR